IAGSKSASDRFAFEHERTSIRLARLRPGPEARRLSTGKSCSLSPRWEQVYPIRHEHQPNVGLLVTFLPSRVKLYLEARRTGWRPRAIGSHACNRRTP